MYDNPGDGCVTENPTLVEYDRWHHQALTAERSGTTVTYTFWTDLPSTADTDKIIITRTEDLIDFPIPYTHDLYFADAPWVQQIGNHETLNGILRNVKIWDGTKSESYLTTNYAADTQLLKSGDSELWYHNPNPTPTDISDKSGAPASDPVWVDTDYKPTLWEDDADTTTIEERCIADGTCTTYLYEPLGANDKPACNNNSYDPSDSAGSWVVGRSSNAHCTVANTASGGAPNPSVRALGS
jgi:hypothetical protein